MYKEYESSSAKRAGRQLVLADNYRLSPAHMTHSRESVYDAPKRVILNADDAEKRLDKNTIRNSVQAVLKDRRR
ncbi:MAG: hypothetical protein GY947_02495 [Rhodobacteraceae bacterium]|nr:hypothetical protein [Paracoccaceae bacterium]